MQQPFRDTSCVDELLRDQVSGRNATLSQSASNNGPNARPLNSTPIRHRNSPLAATDNNGTPIAATRLNSTATTSHRVLGNELAIFAFQSNASPFRSKAKHASYSESIMSNQSFASSFSNDSSESCDSSQYSNQSHQTDKARRRNRLDSSQSNQSVTQFSISSAGSSDTCDSSHQSTRTPKARRRNRLDSSHSNLSVAHCEVNQRQLQPSTSRSAQTRAYYLTQPALHSPVNRYTQNREKGDSFRRNVSNLFDRSVNQVRQQEAKMATVIQARRETNYENEISSYQRTENANNDAVRDLCKSLSNSSLVEKQILNEEVNQGMQQDLDPNELERYFSEINKTQRSSTPNGEPFDLDY